MAKKLTSEDEPSQKVENGLNPAPKEDEFEELPKRAAKPDERRSNTE